MGHGTVRGSYDSRYPNRQKHWGFRGRLCIGPIVTTVIVSFVARRFPKPIPALCYPRLAATVFPVRVNGTYLRRSSTQRPQSDAQRFDPPGSGLTNLLVSSSFSGPICVFRGKDPPPQIPPNWFGLLGFSCIQLPKLPRPKEESPSSSWLKSI